MVVDELRLTNPVDPYLTLRALAGYSGCSVRWLRERLVDPRHPLECFRLPGGKVLVRCSTFDAWLGRYRTVGRADVAAEYAAKKITSRVPRAAQPEPVAKVMM